LGKNVASDADWVALGEASRLLGVAPQTLRRWSDDGRIGTFTTPGGHRRYRRSNLERMTAEAPPVHLSLPGAGLTSGRLVRAYRQQARQRDPGEPWATELDDDQRDVFRAHGRRLAMALVAHLDATDPAVADQRLSEATAEAAGYGRLLAGLGVSLSGAVEGFLRFRQPFLLELSRVAVQREFDTSTTTAHIAAAERAMDRLLIAVMAAFSVRQVSAVRHARVARVRAARPL
jgi:excisionase family DNA binding protein